MTTKKHVTPKNHLVLIDVPWYYRSEGGSVYLKYLHTVDGIFDAVVADHAANGGLLNRLITKHGHFLFQSDKYHEHVHISIVDRLCERPLELLLANLKDMRADLKALRPRGGICQHIDDTMGRFVGARTLIETMFNSLPERDPAARFPVGGQDEYESRQVAGTLWENPKRVQLLDVMIWELENRPEYILGMAYLRIPQFMRPFWSKGYDKTKLPPDNLPDPFCNPKPLTNEPNSVIIEP